MTNTTAQREQELQARIEKLEPEQGTAKKLSGLEYALAQRLSFELFIVRRSANTLAEAMVKKP